MTCPECGCEEDVFYGLNIKDLTTQDDIDMGNMRLALRCEHCGFATAFIATLPPLTEETLKLYEIGPDKRLVLRGVK